MLRATMFEFGDLINITFNAGWLCLRCKEINNNKHALTKISGICIINSRRPHLLVYNLGKMHMDEIQCIAAI